MRTFALLPLLTLFAGCGAPPPKDTTPATTSAPAAGARDRITGRQAFVIVPEQSKASYVASEEFFPGALKKLGINAGKHTVIGTTHAIEGRFQLDPAQLAASPGDNVFTVRMNTLDTDQPRRDKYIREDEAGPRFDAYPVATFKATTLTPEPGAPGVDAGELHFKLAGNMTIRDITKPAVFDVKARLMGDTLTGRATSQLLLSDFGIEPLDFYNTLTVADQFGIDVQFTAKPPGPRGQP